jgi:hypothetical protein
MDILQKLKNWKPWATGGQKIVLEETIAEIERLREALRDVIPYVDTCNAEHREAQARARAVLTHITYAKRSEDKGQ